MYGFNCWLYQFTMFIVQIIISGMSYTSMPMRMFRWDLGLLGLMRSILMTGDYVVAPHLVSSWIFWEFEDMRLLSSNYLKKMYMYICVISCEAGGESLSINYKLWRNILHTKLNPLISLFIMWFSVENSYCRYRFFNTLPQLKQPINHDLCIK